jgi:hypothetical protein
MPGRNLVCLALFAFAPIVVAQSTDYIQVPDTPDKFLRFSGNPYWAAKVMNWYYNPANQPAALSQSQVIATIEGAMNRWTAVCNMTFNYAGTTTTGFATNDGRSVILWDAGIGSAAGITNVGFQLSGAMNDADIRLNPAQITDTTTLSAVVTHESGHALGLNHSDVQAAVMAGPPLTSYNSVNYMLTLRQDDIDGCRAIYGTAGNPPPPPPAAGCGGNQPAPQMQQLACGVGESGYMTQQRTYSCVGTAWTAGPWVTTGNSCTEPPDATAIEFYNAGLNHYFVTALADEASAIDQGSAGPGWARTGRSFRVWSTQADALLAPVCRFYGRPGVGPNSHFYTADSNECEIVKLDPGWQYEGISFFARLPFSGTCPDSYVPLLRLYNDRSVVNDSNHRFTTDPVLYQAMISLGWTGEGPVMCVTN